VIVTNALVVALVRRTPDPLERDPGAISQLRMPVLALAGEADMPDFKQAAEEIAQAVPDGRREILAGAGHLAPLETPDLFWDVLHAFLDARS